MVMDCLRIIGNTKNGDSVLGAKDPGKGKLGPVNKLLGQAEILVTAQDVINSRSSEKRRYD